MICIVGDRHSGKTTALVKMAELTGLQIVTPSMYTADYIDRVARQVGARIKTAVPYRADRKHMLGRRDRRVLVDDAQAILESELGCQVEVAVFDSAVTDMFTVAVIDPTTVSLWQLVRRWWVARRCARKVVE